MGKQRAAILVQFTRGPGGALETSSPLERRFVNFFDLDKGCREFRMAKRNRLRRQNKIRNKKFAGLEPLEDRRFLTANVIISEILASNDSIIDDDNGVFNGI